jgi:hypothetical protein
VLEFAAVIVDPGDAKERSHSLQAFPYVVDVISVAVRMVLREDLLHLSAEVAEYSLQGRPDCLIAAK